MTWVLLIHHVKLYYLSDTDKCVLGYSSEPRRKTWIFQPSSLTSLSSLSPHAWGHCQQGPHGHEGFSVDSVDLSPPLLI